jgi:Ni/Co efflux regulator RcnB
MRHYLKSTMAFWMALSMLAAPVAMAQPDQHGDQHSDQHSDQHAAPQHSTMQHTTVQHTTMQQHTMMQHAPVQHSPIQHQYVQHQSIQPAPREDQVSSHHWQHGQHYNGSRRVVSNWQYYHLRQPPHGYEWVQDGSQFVLIAVASGIIADVIANALSQ